MLLGLLGGVCVISCYYVLLCVIMWYYKLSGAIRCY